MSMLQIAYREFCAITRSVQGIARRQHAIMVKQGSSQVEDLRRDRKHYDDDLPWLLVRLPPNGPAPNRTESRENLPKHFGVKGGLDLRPGARRPREAHSAQLAGGAVQPRAASVGSVLSAQLGKGAGRAGPPRKK